jgi:DNA-binding NarL/FixJ family response regulator
MEGVVMNPTTQSIADFDLDLQAARADAGRQPDRAVDCARVVIVDENQLRASTLAAALKGGSQALVTVMTSDARPLEQERTPTDLVLLALGGRNVSALAAGANAIQRNPFAEVVFYCDDSESPEVAAAAALGITRIVPARDMAAWLARAGNLLAHGAFLRRAASACTAAAPRPPVLETIGTAPVRRPLPTAEMQFRESYIRFLLTESGSRQEAARRAGVPYRTMCEMIRKLGIGSD